MMRARSSGVSLAKPSMPNIAMSGSPGRIRMTTKMITETPSKVSAPKAARRTRYFFMSERSGQPATRRPLLRQPGRVPAHHVVDPEDLVRVHALDVVEPNIVDLFPRHRQQRRVLLEDQLGL